MKIVFEEKENDIIFRLLDFDSKYTQIFEACFYQNDSESYYKKFSKDIKHIDIIKSNYQKNAKTMFDQCGHFVSIPWEKGLQNVCSIMHNSGIEWWLTGSCATCIRGIDLNPHDIDIIINSKYLDEAIELYSSYLIEPVIDTNGWITKYFGVAFNQVRIDLAFDPSPELDIPEPSDCGPFAQNNLEEIEWRGFKIKVPPLFLQLKTNEYRGRMDRVEKITEYLEKN